MRWPHTVRIERAPDAGAGTQDKGTGVWAPAPSPAGDPEVLYDGPGDVQHRARTIRRGEDRDVQVVSDADVFLPIRLDGEEDESHFWEIAEGARIVATDIHDAVVVDGHVVSVRPLDGLLYAANLTRRP